MAFYSKLNKKHISDEDYNHAKKVWEVFECKSLKDYHDIYLKSDVLQLADVFENYRYTCLENYGLDPSKYFTAPGLAWDGMLKMTQIELELLTDIDMQLFIEKGMRGGTSFIGKRYSKANNKYMSNFNSEEESKYISYLDANNLYGWGMSKPLPFGGFKWVKDPNNIDLDNFFKQKKIEEERGDDVTKGLMLEVDLEYPKELHDLHNDYPLAPESIVVTKEMLSNYSRNFAETYKTPIGKKQN